MKRLLVLSALALAFYGCGDSSSSGTQQLSDNPAPVDSAPVQVAEKGTVKFQVKFPATGEVSKSLIDENTASIEVSWETYGASYETGSITLYPDPTTGIATGEATLTPGMARFKATAFDGSTPNPVALETVNTYGRIVSGPNSVILTFLTGDWTFVDATTGAASPLTLVGGEVLQGFKMKAINDYYYGDTPYSMLWIDGTGTPFPTPTIIDHDMYFDGAAGINGSIIDGGDYNLTQGFGEDYWNMDTDVLSQSAAGDRFIVVLGEDAGEATFTTGNGTDPTGYLDSTVADGKTITGSIFEATFESMSVVPVTTPTGVCTSESGYYSGGAAAALVKAVSGVGKAAVPLGTLTVTFSECEDVDGDGDGDMAYDYLTYDANNNGQYDPADGDTFNDYNSDGNYDYVLYHAAEVNVTIDFSDANIHPFKATGSQYTEPPPGETTVTVQ